MDPQDININPQNIPPVSKHHPLLKLVVFSLVIVLAMVVGFLLFKQRQTVQELPKISGLEVAVKTASFLDNTLQANGAMLGGFTCQAGQDRCVPLALSPNQPHYGQAIYSYILLADATGDRSHRQKADKAINYVLDRCDTNVSMCEWNFFPLAQYYEKTKEDKYLTRGMLPPADKFLVMPDREAIISNVGHKLASLFSATRDERYKNRLIEIAETQLNNASNDDNFMFQVIWSVYLPAYRTTADPKYLIASKDFYNNYDVAKRISQEKFTDPASISFLIKAADGLLTLDEQLVVLGEKSESYNYRTKAQTILQATLDKLWDTPSSLKYTGDYGFLDIDMSAEETVHKSTLFNGWLIKLFVLMSDENFVQPITK